MALISMYERDNSRTVYRILADEAVRCFDNPKICTEEKIPLTNLARLLERYRYNAFSDHVALGILEALSPKNGPQGGDSRALTCHMEGVVSALEAAHARVYSNLSKDDLVQCLQDILAKLSSTASVNELDAKQQLESARRFFVAFSEALRTL